MKQIAGLHLWEVTVNYTDTDRSPSRQSIILWITTPKENLYRADQKAQKFCRKQKSWSQWRITGIVNHGTIDA